MDLEEANSRINELEAKKSGLIEEVMKLNDKLRQGFRSAGPSSPFGGGRGYYLGPLRKHYDELEFRIATEAYTPKIEKELIKELKIVEAELKTAEAAEKARRAKFEAEEGIKKLKEEQGAVESQLSGIRGELKNLYNFVRDERQKQAEERREQKMDELRNRSHREKKDDLKDEWSQYMKPVDSHVSLEDVVIIEKKKKEE